MSKNIQGIEKGAKILNSIKGIVFDLDDTLYLQQDYKVSGFQAVARWLEENGHGTLQKNIDALLSILDLYGPSYPQMFNRFIEQVSLPDTLIPTLIQVFIHHQPNIKLFPDARSMIVRLRSLYRLGILTDGLLQVQQAKIKALSLENLVDDILYSDSLGLSKPAEQLFAWFENRFQIPGQELVYIADNPKKDFHGANKRGWKTIRVLSGEHANFVTANQREISATVANLTCIINEFISQKTPR